MSISYDIVDRVMDELLDRNGLGNAWDEIDVETQVQIIEALQGLVRAELTKWAQK